MRTAKHAHIFSRLCDAIVSGRISPAARVPSENELARRFQVSRPTAARALRDLHAVGLVERRPGSGTFVRSVVPGCARVLALVAPDPAPKGRADLEALRVSITGAVKPNGYGLVCGPEHRGWDALSVVDIERVLACFVERRVAGVFFAPVASKTPASGHVNAHVLATLAAAPAPVVVIDREDVVDVQGHDVDVVRVDHRRVSCLLTSHLLRLGRRRVALWFGPFLPSARVAEERLAGYREAMSRAGIAVRAGWIRRAEPDDVALMRTWLQRERIDAVVCATEQTAGHVVQTMDALDVEVPDAVAVVGVEDVARGEASRVPLTTVRPTGGDLGLCAAVTMLERLAQPTLLARDIRVAGALAVRRSCGALARNPPASPNRTEPLWTHPRCCGQP